MNVQSAAFVKYSFFHLWQSAMVKPFLSQQDLETEIHCIVTSRLDDLFLESDSAPSNIFTCFQMLLLSSSLELVTGST